APAIEGVEVQGLDQAAPPPEVREALAGADAIVVGPSNPVISIGPILSVPGMRDAIAAADAPVIAVSPFVAGRAVKGPTEKFMAAVGRPATAAGVASLFVGVIGAMGGGGGRVGCAREVGRGARGVGGWGGARGGGGGGRARGAGCAALRPGGGPRRGRAGGGGACGGGGTGWVIGAAHV